MPLYKVVDRTLIPVEEQRGQAYTNLRLGDILLELMRDNPKATHIYIEIREETG